MACGAEAGRGYLCLINHLVMRSGCGSAALPLVVLGPLQSSCLHSLSITEMTHGTHLGCKGQGQLWDDDEGFRQSCWRLVSALRMRTKDSLSCDARCPPPAPPPTHTLSPRCSVKRRVCITLSAGTLGAWRHTEASSLLQGSVAGETEWTMAQSA